MLLAIRNEQSLVFINQAIRALFLKETTKSESWLDKACALLPQLTPEDQEVIYWRMDTMLARRNATTTKTPQEEVIEDKMLTLKALVNLEMADVTKPITLDAILSYVHIMKQRE